MNSLFFVDFKVLNFTLPLWMVLLVFGFIGIICILLYFLILFKKRKTLSFEKEEVSAVEFKRLEKFEDLRNEFELEIAKVKKILKNKKK